MGDKIQYPEFPDVVEKFFEDYIVEIKLFPGERTRKFKTAKSFYKYIIEELQFWSERNVNNCFYNVVTGYANCKSYMDSTLNGNTHNINSAIRVLNSLFSSKSDEVKKFESLRQKNQPVAVAFLNCFGTNSSTYEQEGEFLAFLFKNKVKMSEQPKDYDVQMVDLIEKHHSLYTGVESDFNVLNNQVSERYLDKVDELEQKYENILEEYTTFIDTRNEEFNNLEQLYKNQLQLEAPAEYWKTAKDDHERQGGKWIKATIITGSVFVTVLYFMLRNLSKVSEGATEVTAKMTVILMLLVAVGVFLISLFAKLATSSYHLARDADERHKLVYVYLALLKESSVEQEDRNIVLQSIFSRSDTGLLRGGSNANTPPTSAIQFVMDTTKQAGK